MERAVGEASKVAGAGVVMSAAMASATVNGIFAATDATGHTVINVTKFVAAGDEGWELHGNYVSSKFLFNFNTMQVFDGSETHDIDDILDVTIEDNIVLLKVRGKIALKRVFVGLPHRAQTIHRLISDMSQGTVYAPDTKRRLKSIARRMRVPRIGTMVRYSIRSILLGLFFTILYRMLFDNHGDFRLSEFYTAAIAVFTLSMAWRLFRPIKTPNWRSQ